MLAASLRSWVERELNAEVREASRIGSGASRIIWRVTLEADGETQTVVVRVDSGTGPVANTPLTLEREATVYRALAGRGLPVPHLLSVSPDGAALLMDFVDGDAALATVGDSAERAVVGCDYLCCLGRLHSIDTSTLELPGFDSPSTGPSHALTDVELWADISASRTAGWTSPAVEFALDWLRSNAPAFPSATALCHGDAGPGNFLFADGTVTAMLDWEFAHLGDPHDDLAWVAVRNHLLGRPLDLGASFTAWTTVTAIPVESDLLEYYRVLVLTRMAISCDASIAWKGGAEDESIRTQVLLRPWLGRGIATSLGLAGCDSSGLAALTDAVEQVFAASPYAQLLEAIPPLQSFGAP